MKWSLGAWKTHAGLVMSNPYLDNIETLRRNEKSLKALTQKGCETQNEKNLYTFDPLNDLHKYRILSYRTAVCLMDFGSDLMKDVASHLFHCGSRLGFVDENIASANFCRERLCPMCQRRKSLRTYSDFCKVLEKLSDYSFIHLVLTVPNVKGDELAQTLKAMQDSSTRLFKHHALKKAFKGIARCTEVTYNSKTITFHPHFHCLVAVNKSYFKSRDYVTHKTLVHLWSTIWRLASEFEPAEIKTSKELVSKPQKSLSSLLRSYKDDYIENFPLRNEDFLQLFVTKADKGALPEIAKYAVKPLELDLSSMERAEVLQTLYGALKGKRLIQTYGIIKQALSDLNIDVEADETFEPLDTKKMRLYNFNYRHLRYEEGS